MALNKQQTIGEIIRREGGTWNIVNNPHEEIKVTQ